MYFLFCTYERRLASFSRFATLLGNNKRLFVTVADQSDEVVILDLQVLAQVFID